MTTIDVMYKVPDARGVTKQKAFNALGLNGIVKDVVVVDRYLIDAKLSKAKQKAAAGSLHNQTTQTVAINRALKPKRFSFVIEVGFLPGVTDNVGSTAREAIEDRLGIKLKGQGVYSTQRFFVSGKLSKKDIAKIAASLHNPLIQTHVVNGKLNIPRVKLPKPHKAQAINVDLDDASLAKMSSERTLALDVESMQTIRDYFLKHKKRNPTDIELESLAQTWSEHCKHTIFADPIDEIKDGLYKTYIKGATKKINKKFCVSVFTDNSGAIEFDDDYLVTHKVETHNTPSALDPFGGAITGIVGVNRDTIGFGLGAKPVANFYGFCLAEPNDKRKLYRDAKLTEPMLSPKRIMEGVITGIKDGGNQSGIPTPQGFLYFNDRYIGKPLVFAGTVGLIPRKSKGRLSHKKAARPGDYIVMLGGRVGADGIHGATFSSETLNPNSPATAVQIGDPITQKKFSDAIIREARDQGLYNAITDNGAGGLSSSVGEMAEDTGCEVQLDKVPLKYPGLEPWQIWISESQERMTLAVPPKNWKKFEKLMRARGVEATVIGKFTKTKKCVVKFGKTKIMDLEMAFLHDGRPIKKQITAKPKKPASKPKLPKLTKQNLLKQLSDPNIASNRFISEQYDHTVQGTAVVGPLQGAGMTNGKAAVLAPVLGSKRGIIMSHSLAPELSEADPYGMAVDVIESAIRHAVTAGANPDHIALLDNFCWCSSNEPERLWQLKQTCKACYDTAVDYGTPFISGKDSMFNDFRGYDAKGKQVKISVPPTLLISAIGVIPDVTKVVTEDLKNEGDLLYIVKADKKNYKAYYKAIQKGLVASAISIGRGGINVALAKTAIAGQLGLTAKIAKDSRDIIATINPKGKKMFEKLVQAKRIGKVGGDKIKINSTTISIKDATKAYHKTFKNY